MNDLKFAFRQLLKNPGFTAVAVLTLALGIGASTAIFSVVNAVLLRPLPYSHADQLVTVWATDRETHRYQDSTSYPDFADWREQNHTFACMAAYTVKPFNMAGGNQPERLIGLRASADLFPVLGLIPSKGRAFLPHEQEIGRDRVVIVSDSLWKRRLGADPDLVGKTIVLDDESCTVLGILPPDFQFPPYSPFGPIDVIVPFGPNLDRGGGHLFVVGRLKPDVPIEKAQAELASIARRLEQAYPATDKGRGVNLVPMHQAFTGGFRPAFMLMAGTVGLLLLIACSNVANLLLARGIGRQKEVAVRAALGASRLRIVRQLLTESLLLAGISGIVALLSFRWGIDSLVAMLSQYMPIRPVPVDRFVLAWAVLISFLTVPIFGSAPAFALSRHNLQQSLKEGGRASSVSLHHSRLQSALVVAQTGLALMLLIGAGLLIKSFFLIERISPGFPTEDLLTAHLPLSPKYSRPEARESLFGKVLTQVRALPGVESAALVADLPFRGGTHETFSIEGQPDPDARRGHPADFNVVSPGYFHTMRIPLLAGREFAVLDSRNAPDVAIINEAMRRRFWPGEDPIGKRLRLYYDSNPNRWFAIVGVVSDVRRRGLMSEVRPEVFLSYSQDTHASPMTCVLRSRSGFVGLAAAVQQSVWAVDKDQPVSDVLTMEEIRSQSIAQPRVLMFLLGLFAALALTLAGVGVYGVISCSVKARLHEIGIRMALGARRGQVLKMILKRGMILTLFGGAIGAIAATGLTQFITGLLYGVKPLDLATYSSASVLLIMAAALACLLPAHRATRIDPMEALRYE